MARLVDITTVLAGVSAVFIAGIVAMRTFDAPVPAEGRSAGTVEEWHRYAEDAHRIGRDDAAITVLEWGDYECPYCRSSASHLRNALTQGDIALVYRHLPLPGHPRAYSAAIAAECAGEQGRFWAYHDHLYTNDTWQRDRRTDAEVFESIAQSAEVEDPEAFRRCFETEAPAGKINSDIAAANELGIRSTPSFLVNGQKYIGAMDSVRLDIVLDVVDDGVSQ